MTETFTDRNGYTASRERIVTDPSKAGFSYYRNASKQRRKFEEQFKPFAVKRIRKER